MKSLKREHGHDAILIDTAGFKSAMAMHAIAAAQLVLIPSKASEADARGARRTWSHVRSVAETVDRSIPAAVVLTDVDMRTVIARAITAALDSHGVPRLKTVLPARTGFREMASTGKLAGAAREAARTVLDELYGSEWISVKGDQ